MKAPLERIRVSQRSRDTLSTLKRRTGIEHWNVLCRWAFLDSLSNPNRPVIVKNLPESNLEIHWDVFAGELADYLLAAFAVRAAKDGVKPATVRPVALLTRLAEAEATANFEPSDTKDPVPVME